MTQIVGIDFGGTWLRIARVAIDDAPAPLVVEKVPSPTNWESLLAVLKRYRGDDVTGFGLAVSGPVADHTTLIRGPNLSWLSGRNLGRDLAAALECPVVVANDMEAATEGEMARGALRRYKWAIFDTISTGWGGNLVLDGRRVDGEPGHANVTFDSPYQCGAGHVGCLEALYSGSALARRIRERMADTAADEWEFFNAQVAADDPWAVDLLDRWAEGVGRAWANTLNRIRPIEAIVYMGTTAENLLGLQRVRQRLRETIARIAMFPEHRGETFPILPAEYADRSLYGAAVIFGRYSSSSR